GATTSDDGKTVTLTKNGGDPISINLSNILKNDMRLVANPAADSNGEYAVDGNGNITLKVQNADGSVTHDVVLKDVASKNVVDNLTNTVNNIDNRVTNNTTEIGKGLNFAANSGDTYNAKLGSTITVQGKAKQDGHTYSADNLTTEIDANGNITILMDEAISANSVKVGKDGKDGVSITGPNGKNGADGVDGKVGISGKDGKDAVSISGKDGVGHIGLTGPKGKDGQDGVSIDITTDSGKATLDPAVNNPVGSTTSADRIIYTDSNNNTHQVATMDDGLLFKGDNATVITKKLNEQVDIVGGATGTLTDNNIGVNAKDGKLKVQLAKDINLTDAGSVTIGGTTINKDGMTIQNGPSITTGGIDAGGKQITNVASGGDVGTNAANIDDVKRIVETTDKDTITIVSKGNGIIVEPSESHGKKEYAIRLADTFTISANEGTGERPSDRAGDANKFVTIAGKDGTITAGYYVRAGGAEIGFLSGLPLRDKDGKLTGEDADDGNYVRSLDNKDWDIKNPTYVSGRAATEDQLKVVSDAVDKASASHTVVKAGDNVTVSETTNADGAKEYTVAIKKDVNLGQDGSLTTGDTKINNEGVTVGGDTGTKIASGGVTVGGDTGTKIASGGVTVGGDTGTKITSDGITIGNGDNAITIKDKDVSMGGNQITNIGSGIDGKKYEAAKDNNAASIGDVKKLADEIAKANDTNTVTDVTAGNGIVVTPGPDNNDKNKTFEVKLADDFTVGKDDKAIHVNGNEGTVTVGAGDNKVTVDGVNGTITVGKDSNKVTIDGNEGNITAGNTVSGKQTIAADKVLGKDGKPVSNGSAQTGNYVTGLDNTKWDITNPTYVSGRAATEDQLKTVSDVVNEHENKMNKGRVFQSDSGEDVTVGLGATFKLNGGADVTNLSNNNIGVVNNANKDGFDIKLSKDLTGLHSATFTSTEVITDGYGNAIKDKDGKDIVLEHTTTIGGNGSAFETKIGGTDIKQTVSIAGNHVDMGGNQIHGVAPGTADNDAVNVSQLNRVGQKLGERISYAGANAAALAALHPLDFDPDDKWDFAAGYGNYSGANAAAIGAYYRPNEDTMFSIGASLGGGENMVNAGVSVKLGQGNHVSTSRVAMAKEIKDMRSAMAAQDAKIAELTDLVNKLVGMKSVDYDVERVFPDIPENHWAYDYVSTLAGNGIVEGYPNGYFDGNRTMTRYEMAAVIYRALQNGAAQDANMIKALNEFKPELERFRVDTISKHKDGTPDIQRVRVINNRG
ncbi:S-layer homology domain-containing protein, partial [Veillonella caviae]|uniref:S-layer homology domain-containing protein n=1 Tax=Veillonella caviae TaxID=248316 RepID=UPI002357F178